MEEHGQDSSGSVLRPVAGSYEHGNGLLDFIIATIGFSRGALVRGISYV
jgi:hypothetical protein